MTVELKPHPAAEIFPLMTGAEHAALVADIRENGLRDPLVLHDGMILDGRNRYGACREAGVEPRTETWIGQGTPQAYVVSKNLHRRHLNESQRALIAARLATLKRGKVLTQRDNYGGQICPPAVSAGESAELLNVSRQTVKNAKTVLLKGAPEEVAAVQRGEAAVGTLAKLIREGVPAPQRKKMRETPLAQAGKNPERIQRQQINAEIWSLLRDGLTHLTSLPLPADVVAIARAHDRTDLVDARLARALKWLKEFSDEWSNASQDAARKSA